MNPGTGIAALKNSTFPGLKIERDLGHPFILGWSDLGHSPKVRALPGAQMRGTWGTHPQWLCAQLPRHLGHPPTRPRFVLSQVPKCEAPGAPILSGCAHSYPGTWATRQLGPGRAPGRSRGGTGDRLSRLVLTHPSPEKRRRMGHPVLLGMLYLGTQPCWECSTVARRCGLTGRRGCRSRWAAYR
jgi:hypothetical protein